ncbi:MAG: hisE [Firmicutes bacterium]|nr:hisE [Bacillota bacterium]
MSMEHITFNKDGLIPAIVQDAASGEVLMLAYMNKESLEKTMESGETWFFSRSRQALWHKGETSGHIQKVRELYYDCDGDTLLVKVDQTGVACHEGTYSCFSRKVESVGINQGEKLPISIIYELFRVIKDRQENPAEGSYTTYLFNKGQDKILKKVGEEAAETIIASKNNSQSEILYEMADLWYHCLVLLVYHKLTPTDLFKELDGRRK